MRFTETFFSSDHWCDAYHVEYGEVNVVSCDRFDLAQKFVLALTGEDVKAQTTAIDYRPRSVLTVDSRCDVFNMYATNKGELEKFRANLAGTGVVLLSFPENWTPFDKIDELVEFVRDSTEAGIQTFVFTKSYLFLKTFDLIEKPRRPLIHFIGLRQTKPGKIAIDVGKRVDDHCNTIMTAYDALLDRVYSEMTSDVAKTTIGIKGA